MCAPLSFAPDPTPGKSVLLAFEQVQLRAGEGRGLGAALGGRVGAGHQALCSALSQLTLTRALGRAVF